VIGEVVGRPVLRRGACPGDVIAMTGAIGERGAGLHALLAGIDAPEFVGAYLHPEPRIAAGQWLQGKSGVHAMMDVSDGLLPDARHIASASGVGVALWRDRLPIHRGLEAYWTAHGEDCVHQRLQSGEEYELLVVLDAEESVALCSDFFAETGLPLHVLGHCVDGPPIITLDGEPLARAGFEHFRDTPSE
jgi:thiamine-monophosphate kinase